MCHHKTLIIESGIIAQVCLGLPAMNGHLKMATLDSSEFVAIFQRVMTNSIIAFFFFLLKKKARCNATQIIITTTTTTKNRHLLLFLVEKCEKSLEDCEHISTRQVKRFCCLFASLGVKT